MPTKPKRARAKPAPKPKPAKKTGKELAAARANGAKGGRPVVPEAGFDGLRPPPLDLGPLALHRWAKEVAAQLVWMDIRKQISPERTVSIRNNIRTLIAAMPLDISAEVHKLLMEEQTMLAGSAGDPDTVSADSLGDDDGATKPTRSISG
jgi:hypothetical protein